MKIIVFMILSLALGMVLGCKKTSRENADWIEFMPIDRHVKQGDHLLVDAPELKSPQFTTSLRSILDGYGVEYRMIEGKIYISNQLAADWDLCANFTDKAVEIIPPAKPGKEVQH